jgi:hypothetical protein
LLSTSTSSNNTNEFKLFCFSKGKEVNENATVPRDDMIFTVGQLNAARDGILIFNKWDNEKGEGSAKAVLPYQFDNKINKDEQLIVKSVIQRFNKDMKTCLEIKYVLICLKLHEN